MDRLLHGFDDGADAACHVPEAAVDSPQRGNLDVPLSVWPIGTELPALVAGVVSSFTTPGDLVAVTMADGAARVAAAGRRLVAMCHRRDIAAVEADLAEVDATRRAHAHIHTVTDENLSSRLVGLPGKLDLLIVTDEVRWCEGFWNAAKHSLRPGGHVAVISATADSAVHASVNAAASDADLGYAQHLLACSPQTLNDAVMLGTAPPRRNRGRCHQRGHVDVFVFARRAVRTTGAEAGNDR